MSIVTNPYLLNLLHYSQAAFFGRRDDVRLLERGAQVRPPRSFVLIGPRAIGKSWLLRFLSDPEREHEDGTATVVAIYCDLRERKQLSLLGRVAAALVSAENRLVQAFPASRSELQRIKEGLEQAPSAEAKPHQNGQNVQRLREPLLRLCRSLADEPAYTLQLCLDHFGDVLNDVDDSEEVFLRELVTLVSFVVTIRSDMLEKYLEQAKKSSPFLNTMLLRYVGSLSATDARRLITVPYEAQNPGLRLEEAEIEFLIAAAGRHPLLLTLACDYYVTYRTQLPNLETAGVGERLIQGMLAMPEITRYCDMIWSDLTRRQHHVVRQIVAGAGRETIEAHRASLKDVISRSLLLEDLVKGEYRPFSEIFAHYVAALPPEPEQVVAPSVDPLTAVEAELPPLERRLLGYLRDHAGEVCAKEDLLKHVWIKEQGSWRALEAAIYRIRSRLSEAGGGNWEYIQTIRRRGYKFVPH
ncbi:MAG: AAA family ATPase [Oscillochloris sp.]|nr:AAA family ATPase [Oscillochloris sp.]